MIKITRTYKIPNIIFNNTKTKIRNKYTIPAYFSLQQILTSMTKDALLSV